MKVENNQFGKRLNSIRKGKKITLKKLAEKSGTSDSYLSQLETGKRNPPKPELLKKIAFALGSTKDEELQRYSELMLVAGYALPEEELLENAYNQVIQGLIENFNEIVQDQTGVAFTMNAFKFYHANKEVNQINALLVSLFDTLNKLDELPTKDNTIEIEAKANVYLNTIINQIKGK